jgi:acetyl-CoA carboxylase biotin carboxylase subunit
MVAKLVAHGSDRAQAIARLRQALAQTHIAGVKTNIPFIERILGHADFLDLRIDTGIAQRVLATL